MRDKSHTARTKALAGICALGLAITLAGCKTGPTELTEEDMVATAVAPQVTNYFSTVEQCQDALKHHRVEQCSWLESYQQITKPEWEALFPDAHFYEVKTRIERNIIITGTGGDIPYYVFAWQDGQHYTTKTFDRFLAANGIVVTDENRELVAKAFVLMDLPGFLEKEVVFVKWEEGDWSVGYDYNHNYLVEVWTRIDAVSASWTFAFEDNHLRAASRASGVFKEEYGDRYGEYVLTSRQVDLLSRGTGPLPSRYYEFRGE